MHCGRFSGSRVEAHREVDTISALAVTAVGVNRNDRALTGFAMLGHATFHTYELVLPIFVAVWLDAFPVSPATLGVIVGASYALIGLGAVPSGLLADRLGSKPTILACMAGMGGAFGLLSVAPNLATLAVGLLAWGLAASVYHPAGLALLSRGASERGVAFAYHGAAGNVGVATGPLLAAVLLTVFGWRTVAAILVAPAVVAILAGLRLDFDERPAAPAADGGPNQPDGQSTGRRSFLTQSRRLFTGAFVLVLAVGVLYGIYYRGATTFLPEILGGLPIFEPLDLGGRTVEPARYVFAGLLLLGGVGQYVGGRLVDSYPVERVLVAAYVGLVAVALILIPAADAGVGPLLAVAGVFGFLVFLVAPVNQEAISAYTPAAARGLSFGYSYTAIFGLGAAGATLAGVVLTRSTPFVLFVLLAGVAGAAALIGVVLDRRGGRAPDTSME